MSYKKKKKLKCKYKVYDFTTLTLKLKKTGNKSRDSEIFTKCPRIHFFHFREKRRIKMTKRNINLALLKEAIKIVPEFKHPVM